MALLVNDESVVRLLGDSGCTFLPSVCIVTIFSFSSKSTSKLLLLPHVFIFNPNPIFYIYMLYHINWGETNVIVSFSFFFLLVKAMFACIRFPIQPSIWCYIIIFKGNLFLAYVTYIKGKYVYLILICFRNGQTNHVMYRTKYDSIAVTFGHVIGFPGIKPATFGGKPDAAHNSQ